MRYLILLLSVSLYAENILTNQGGVALGENKWTQLTSPSGYLPGVQGYDRMSWNPIVGKTCGYMNGYRSDGSEPNRSYSCFSAVENRWDVYGSTQPWHTDQTPDSGHPMEAMDIDVTSGIMYGLCCFSGGQVPTEMARHTYAFDFLAQAGRDLHFGDKPYVQMVQPGGAFDPAHQTLVIFAGDGGNGTGTTEFNPATRTWTMGITTTCSTTCPSIAMYGPAMAYNSNDGKIYLFGGSVSGTYQNAIFRYNQPTHTWENLSPTGTPPAGRVFGGWAFDPVENVFLLHGGYGTGNTILGDDWIYDVTANSWSQLTPLASPPTPASPPYGRMVYDESVGAFILFEASAPLGSMTVWAYSYKGSSNAAYKSYTYTQAAGLNRNATGSPTWILDGDINSTGSVLLQNWSELGGPADLSSCGFWRAFANTNTNGTVTNLGTLCTSIFPDSPILETSQSSAAWVNGVPWIAYQLQNNSGGATGNSIINAVGYSAGSWSLGGTIGTYMGWPQLANVNNVPYIALIQTVRDAQPSHNYFQVWKWTSGTSFAQVGGNLNVTGDASNITSADSVSITSDGTNPWVAWSEYTSASISNPVRMTDTKAKIYIKNWNGSAWVQACSTAANVSGTSEAHVPSIAMIGSIPYVAFVEDGRLVVRKCQSSTWTTIGASNLNVDVNFGWTLKPHLISDGSANLWLAWSEQGNNQSWVANTNNINGMLERSQIYVMQWSGSAWTRMGGSVNKDTARGSANDPRLALVSNSPVIQWGEVTEGYLRQLYALQWNGADWQPFPAPLPTGTGSTHKGKLQGIYR